MSDLSLQGVLQAAEAGVREAPGPEAALFDAPSPDALGTLLALARRAREAGSEAELRFIAVNETHALVPYRQAALWRTGSGVVALSGVVAPEANGPYVQWLDTVFRALDRPLPGAATAQGDADSPRSVTPEDLPAEAAAAWAEWLPAAALALPLASHRPGRPGPGGRPDSWLLLAREPAFDAAEAGLLAEWAGLWSQAAQLQAGRRRGWLGSAGGASEIGRDALGLLLRRVLPLAALAAVLALPVRLSVLAPAELVPLNPAVVRAPLDGVVGKVLVQPNQAVKAGQPLFEFDRASLDSRLELARRALGTVQAEYRQKSQRALFDPEAKSQLAVLQGQIDEKQTEVAYLGTLSSRGTVPAPRAGLVLFGDASEWVGKPVVTGERVMVVADPQSVELEGWLAPADVLPLAPGSTVTLYLNTDPLHPVTARLRSIGHEAVERPDGHMAYRVRATLDDGSTPPRVGLKGTAKLEGERVPLAYWVLRRPLAAARAWAGV